MPQPILCQDAEVRQCAERFRSVFSKPQEEYVVTVLLGLRECEGRRMRSGSVSTIVVISTMSEQVLGPRVSKYCGLSLDFADFQRFFLPLPATLREGYIIASSVDTDGSRTVPDARLR